MTWQSTAESVALDMARRAIVAAMAEASGTAWRSYTLDSGLLKCRATFDGESVVTSWDIDGRPLNRAAAETQIAGRMASRAGRVP